MKITDILSMKIGNQAVKQVRLGSKIVWPDMPSGIIIWQRGQLLESTSRSIERTYVNWTFESSGVILDYFTPRSININDPVYTTPALTTQVADTYIANIVR